MQPVFSQAYLDALFTTGSQENLVEISALLSGSAQFSPTQLDYGLDAPLFVFIESLTWFSQSLRSGAWTYFDATDPDRQAIMIVTLKSEGPEGFAQQYAFGAAH